MLALGAPSPALCCCCRTSPRCVSRLRVHSTAESCQIPLRQVTQPFVVYLLDEHNMVLCRVVEYRSQPAMLLLSTPNHPLYTESPPCRKRSSQNLSPWRTHGLSQARRATTMAPSKWRNVKSGQVLQPLTRQIAREIEQHASQCGFNVVPLNEIASQQEMMVERLELGIKRGDHHW